MEGSRTIAPAPAGRADQLQFLRFLAFLNVFICHGEVWNFFHYPASHSGRIAVSFFFMLSGVVVGYSGFCKNQAPTPGNIARDMWRRVRRIFPLYALTQLVMVLYSSVPGMVAAGDFRGLGEFALGMGKTLLFLQAWPNIGAVDLNGASWFLSVLMFLSLWNLPALWAAGVLKKRRWRFAWYVGAFFLTMVAVVIYCYATQGWDMDYYHYGFPPARLGEYLGGILLGYAIRDFKGGTLRIPGPVCTVLELAALAFWAFSLPRGGNYWMNHIVSWLIPNTLLLAAFTLGEGQVSRLLRWKPLVWLGDISFACYLVHHIIILQYTINHSAGPMTVFNQAFAFFYCLLTTLAIAAMLHRKPGRS